MVTALPTASSNGDAPALRGDSPAIHQATGMVMVQLDVSITVADARLRAYAIEVHRPLADVARDVVTHRLRLD